MTERKRAQLDLSSFTPKPAPAEPLPSATAELAREQGFQSRIEPQQRTEATVLARSKEPHVRIPLDVPKSVRTMLQDAARARGFGTVRALVLDALYKQGYPIPADEIADRRKTVE